MDIIYTFLQCLFNVEFTFCDVVIQLPLRCSFNINMGISLCKYIDFLLEHPEIPCRMGTVNNIEKFDADFFGLSSEQAHALTPETRLLLEHSYEAVIDAGFNPKQLRGKNTAVIIATYYIETQSKMLYEDVQVERINN